MLTAVTGGIIVAAIILLPLAVRWGLPMRVVAPWGLLVGALAGGSWAAVLGVTTHPWAWLVAVTGTVMVLSTLAATAAFFRDPERSAPEESDLVVSPADGTVIYVRSFDEGVSAPVSKHGRPLNVEELATVDVGRRGQVIGIGMHLLNVHVNRAPVGGEATLLVHTPGKFMSLKREEATTRNERFTTVIESDRCRVAVVQIASRLVRRIVTYLAVGQEVRAGQRIGMIRFGSQVDLILPDADTAEVLVKPGDGVSAGTTPVARWRTGFDPVDGPSVDDR